MVLQAAMLMAQAAMANRRIGRVFTEMIALILFYNCLSKTLSLQGLIPRMKRLSENQGSLYVIATPIGNFADLSARAAQLLKEVDGVYAEDTRTSQALFREIGCNPPAQSLHEVPDFWS